MGLGKHQGQQERFLYQAAGQTCTLVPLEEGTRKRDRQKRNDNDKDEDDDDNVDD